MIGPSQLGMPGGASSPQLQVWSCWQCLQACDRAMTTGRTYTDTWTHKHYMQLPTPPPPPPAPPTPPGGTLLPADRPGHGLRPPDLHNDSIW